MYRPIKLLAALSYLAVGVAGLLLCVRFVLSLLGGWAAVAAALIFPVTLVTVPWAALIRDGVWAPLVVVYGGLFVAGLLHALARALERGARSEPRGGEA